MQSLEQPRPSLAFIEEHFRGRGINFTINSPRLDAIGINGKWFDFGRTVVTVFPREPIIVTLEDYEPLNKFAADLLPPEIFRGVFSGAEIVNTYPGQKSNQGLLLPKHRFVEQYSFSAVVSPDSLHEGGEAITGLGVKEVVVVAYPDRRLQDLDGKYLELKKAGQLDTKVTILESLGWWVVHGEVLEWLKRNREPMANYFRRPFSLRLAS